MGKEEYRQQIIKNLEDAELEELKIIDSVVKPLVDQPSPITYKERMTVSILLTLYNSTQNEEAISWLHSFAEGFVKKMSVNW